MAAQCSGFQVPDDVLLRPDAASYLYREFNGLDDSLDGWKVFRAPGHRSVQVHHMDARRLPEGPHLGCFHRILVVQGLLVHLSLYQANAPAFFQIDGGDDFQSGILVFHGSRLPFVLWMPGCRGSIWEAMSRARAEALKIASTE